MKYILTFLLLSSSNVFANEIGKPFVQLGHTKYIMSVTYSPNGKYIVTGSADRTAILWDVDSGKVITTFKSKKKSYIINNVAFSPNGKQLLTVDRIGGVLKFWNVSSGEEIKSFKFEVDFSSVAFSQDNQYLVLGSHDEGLKLWDIKSEKFIKTFKGHSKGVTSLAFSPDGQKLISGSRDDNLKLWDIQSGNEIKTFKGHTGKVTSVAFSPDGQQLVSGSWDTTLKLWDVQSGKEIKTFKGHTNSVKSLAFSPDGQYLVSGSGDATLKLWDVQSGKPIKTFKGHTNAIFSVAFSPDGQQLASVGYDKTLKLWDVAKGQLIKTMKGDSTEVTSVALSPNGQKFISSSDNNTLKLWDMKNGYMIKTFKGHSKKINSVVFSPDGQQLVSGSDDKTLKLWDVHSGEELKTFKGHSDDVNSVAFSPDGRYIASGSDDEILKLWDAKSGGILKTFTGHSRSIKYIAFSKNGQQLISGNSTHKLKLWNVQSGQEIKDFGGRWNEELFSKFFSPNSYDYAIAFSTISKKFVTHHRRNKNALVILKVTTKKPEIIQIYNGHIGDVSSIALSSDDKQLLSGSKDTTVKLWDVDSGKEIAQYVAFNDGEWVVITPDGYFNSSKNGAKYLNVRTDSAKVTSIDAYYEKYYRPDIVKLALAGKHIDTSERLADLKTPPRVEIIKTASSSNKDNIKVTLKITDLGGGIGDIRLYRNDTAVKLDGSRALIRHKKTDKILFKDYVVKLENGTNEIKAIAFDEKNWGRSEYATHLVTANIQARKPALHAVVIGIEKYRNSKLNLNYAVDDAELFSNSIKQYSKGLFSDINIELLTTKEDTSKEAITAKLKAMQRLNPQDLFVFYVASHGTVDDGSYYMITSNVGSTSTHKLKKDALSQEMIKNLISNIPTTKKIIILDTCNSQAMGDSLQVAMMTRGMSEDTAMKVLSRAVGSTILSASTSTQEALEGYKGHGLFTHVLAEGLKGKADSNKDGFVKTNELADYIEDNVPELAEKVFNREQFPTTARNGLAYPIAKVQ